MLDETTRVDTDIPISDLVLEYLDDCRIRNLSPTTLRWYDDRLTLLLADCWDAPISSLKMPHVKAVTARLLQSRAPATVNGYLRTLKSMLYYAVDNEYPVAFAPRRIKKIKEPKRIPPCFTVEQVEAMLAQPDLTTFKGLRDFTMMSVLLDVGLRLSELTGLRLHDINIPHLKVRGKGDKERIVATSDAMVKRLRKYLRTRARVVRRFEVSTDLVFPSRYGSQMAGRTVDEMLKRYGAKAGVEGVRVSCHTWRFTYTSLAVRNGMSLTSLQTCLGHATLTMTRHYAILNDTDAFDESREFSPLAALGKKGGRRR